MKIARYSYSEKKKMMRLIRNGHQDDLIGSIHFLAMFPAIKVTSNVRRVNFCPAVFYEYLFLL